MKHRKKNYEQDQKSSETQNDPEWFNKHHRTGIRSGTSPKSGRVSSEREVQFSDGDIQSKSRSQRGSKSERSRERTVRIRRPKSGRKVTKPSTDGNKSDRIGKFDITLAELRESLDKDILKALIDGSYNPNQIVTLKYTPTGLSKLAEDAIRGPIIQRRRIKTVKKQEPPSIKYGKIYERYKKGEVALDAGAVFGRYLMLYKEQYGEEDPEFVGKKTNNALYHIEQMARDLTQGEYEKIIEFIDKIMPLWAKQLRLGANFPSTRPSFDTFFVKRKIWSQRFNLVRLWKS